MKNHIVVDAGVFLRKTVDGRVMMLTVLPEGCIESDNMKTGEFWLSNISITAAKKFKAPSFTKGMTADGILTSAFGADDLEEIV